MPVISIDQKIAEFLNSLQTNGWAWGNLILIFIAILLTVVLSSFVGFEREIRGRSAGLRTHLLVAVGSCVIMIISIYGLPVIGDAGRDPARLAAQVITGVGFLGAGAIIHYAGGIRGLTTAGTIWLVMAIGLACGSMNFTLAIFSTAIVMIVLTSFRRIERRVTKNHPMIIVLTSSDRPILTDILGLAREFNSNVTDIATQIIQDGKDETLQVTFRVSNENNGSFNLEIFTNELRNRTNAIDIKVVNHH